MLNQFIFENGNWAKSVATILVSAIKEVLKNKPFCTFFLTGGRGAGRMYPFLAKELEEFSGQIHFYLGDERCVSELHEDSNCRMILKTLFPDGIGNNHKFFRMFDGTMEPDAAAINYEAELPEKPDLILLGLGDDGHIASLFPHQDWQDFPDKKVLTCVSPYNGQMRISINQQVIHSAEKIFILASGKSKQPVLSKIEADTNIADIPVRMAKNAIWLLDTDAGIL
jgi:6-phosphogluconolactonase